MKKFCKSLSIKNKWSVVLGQIVLLLIVSFGCTILSACKDDYANMGVTYFSHSGSQIDKLELVLETDNTDSQFAIQFNGIDADLVGQLEVDCSLSGVDCQIETIKDSKCFVKLSAYQAGDGVVSVKHLATGKSFNLPVSIKQKSNNLIVDNSIYYIAIPSENIEQEIDASKLVSLEPSASADKVYFKLANSPINQNLPSGVTINYETIGEEELITSLNLTKDIVVGSKIVLNPVTTFDEFENTTYTQTIELQFVKKLEQTDVKLSTDVDHSEYINSTYVLIANDSTQVSTTLSETYTYNTAKFDINIITPSQEIGEEDSLTNIFDSDLINYYDVELSFDQASMINATIYNKQVVLYATGSQLDTQTITIKLKPKCVGELKELSLTIKAKAETKPTDFKVVMNGDELTDLTDIQLFDYYASQTNAFGANFCFTPIETYCYSDLQSMQIRIKPALLNAIYLSGENSVGVNPIYTDNTFATRSTADGYGDKTENLLCANSHNVLNFYLNKLPMKFYYDDTLEMFVSENFTSEDLVSTKSVETAIITERELTCTLVNTYTGNLQYLKNIVPTAKTMIFNSQQGISSVNIGAGLLNGNEIQTYNQNETVKTIYLNRKDTAQYVLTMSEVKGYPKDKTIVVADFVVSVLGGGDNPVKLQQNTASLDEGFYASIDYEYNASKGIYNAILIDVDSNTDLGEYQIKFEHANGYTYVVKCIVYQEITTDDLAHNIDAQLDEYSFYNIEVDGDNQTYKYKDYAVDYIVDSNQTINVELSLLNDLSQDYILDTRFSVTDADTYADYISINKTGKVANITFEKGTYFNEQNNYITLTLTALTQAYQNIATLGEENETSIELTFFVYDRVQEKDLTLNNRSIVGYKYGKLGAYYKDLGVANLKVNMANDLWNYCLPSTQKDEYNLGVAYISIGEDATYDSTAEYYIYTANGYTKADIDAENFEENKLNLLVEAGYKTIWLTSNVAEYVVKTAQTDSSLSLRLDGSSQSEICYVDIYAEVKQFTQTFTLRARVTIKDPVVTEKLELNTNYIYVNNEPTINLTAGQTLNIDVKNVSLKGSLTSPDIVMLIVDKDGNVNRNVVSIYDDERKIRVADEFNISSGLKLLIFAKDALSAKLSDNDIYDNPQEYLLDFPDDIELSGAYLKAYLEIDLLLSNGEESNPYCVFDADDFWQIKNGLDKHYTIMNNIDLTATTYTGEKVISEFTGSINTLNGENYTIFGTKLDKDNPSLFKNLKGKISNLNFDVEYDYEYADLDYEINLGLINKTYNDAVVENVGVNVSGTANINGAYDVYFGGLVGKNNGTIKYTKQLSGVKGEISLSGNCRVRFGGLVGKNVGSILGYEMPNNASSELTYGSYIENMGAMASAIINATLTNFGSCVGGVVGYNTSKVHNAYVTGKITANYNVGGVIGWNAYATPVDLKIGLTSGDLASVQLMKDGQAISYEDIANIYQAKSSAIIVGSNNVGGLVGYDNNGVYIKCKYQVLQGEGYAIKGSINVGGLIGYGENSYLEYCSVMSYRWADATLSASFVDATADIYGESNYTAGLIGKTKNYEQSIENDKIINTTAIVNSGVEAYISSNYVVAGLVGSGSGTAVALNTYFIGHLVGVNATNLKLVNSNALINKSYSIIDGTTKEQNINSVDTQIHTTNTNWQYDADLNHGKIYVVYDNDGVITPIFDIVPTKITSSITTEYSNNQTSQVGENLAMYLYYYDFILDATDDNYIYTYSTLNEQYNTHDLTEMFDFVIKPDLADKRISVESSDAKIVEITGTKLVVKNTGRVTLTFTSLLNQQVYTQVEIYVVAPFGDITLLGEEKTSIDNATLNIAKGDNYSITISTLGKLNYNGVDYYYTTTNDILLDYETTDDIDGYLSITTQPFNINVLDVTDTIFNLKVRPYTIVGGVGIEYSTYFDVKVSTYSGAKAIALDNSSIIVYPNDEKTITAYIDTDRELTQSEINQIVESETDLTDILNFISTTYDATNELQIVKYSLNFVNQPNTKQEINIDFVLQLAFGNGSKTSLKIVVLPQKITKIDVKNYVVNDSDAIQENNSLRPDKSGLIIINLAPNNAYYDYLEISDVTGGEEIIFYQTSQIGSPRLSGMTTPSSDGLGIKLKNLGSTLYVTTMIDKDYSSKTHTIKVSAYLSDGTKISSDYYLYIDVKMLPEVDINYIAPNGQVSTETKYLALGVEEQFSVVTKNSNGSVSYELYFNENEDASEYFGFEESQIADVYTLVVKKYDSTILGKTLNIKVKTRATMDNGEYEDAEDTLSLKIVNFVIHNFSVTHSTSSNTIYGTINQATSIEFYLKATDYSIAQTTSKEKVNAILTAINSLLADYTSNYVSFNDSEDISLTYNAGLQIIVTQSTEEKLTLTVPLKLDDDYNFVIDLSSEEKIVNTFNLDFNEQTSIIQPKLIASASDFVEMNNGLDYILGCDITLENYSPLDLVLSSFDGNGHTITIKNFVGLTDADMCLGLFKQVYEDMLVMNLTVNYTIGSIAMQSSGVATTYIDVTGITSGVTYSSIVFGGITANNYGIITNCATSGCLVISGSMVEELSSTSAIDFDIAGLVGYNYDTGRITNSSSTLKMSAKANIAGLVYNNQGKIASSYYDANASQGLIYAYNNNVAQYYDTSVAGFVVDNSGEISMCYIESGKNANAKYGNFSALKYSAGFVYDNSGKISNCYAEISDVLPNIEFSGFVKSNSGSITTCYTFINNGSKSPIVNMFAPNGTTNITNCYEIKVYVKGYNSGIEGLTTINNSNKYAESNYSAFAFGDGVNSVWYKEIDGLPKLVATSEKVVADTQTNTDEVWYGLRTITKVTTTETNEDGDIISTTITYKVSETNYGSKTNPIIIYNVDTWNAISDKPYYYRLVNDIDFSDVYTCPETSELNFTGNLQGNNMTISGFMIYCQNGQTTDSIGLFKQLVGEADSKMEYSVRNLVIESKSIFASSATAVGSLAGVASNYKLYNIVINSQENIVVGGNAVGGLCGVVKGDFIVENIEINVGARASSSTEGGFIVYQATNDGHKSTDNLEYVSYAGSLIGIADSDKVNFNVNATRNASLEYNYEQINNIKLNGYVSVIGECVGGLVGFLGEKVMLSNSSVSATSGALKGGSYAGGLVGENRGAIKNCSVEFDDFDAFNYAEQVVGGLVGLNLGGYIGDCSFVGDIVRTSKSSISGAIAGRNIYGSAENTTIDAKLEAYYVGLVYGSNYSYTMMENNVDRFGISDISTIIPNHYVYSTKLNNIVVSNATLAYIVENLNYFYTINQTAEDINYAFNVKKTLGIIGLSDSNNSLNYQITLNNVMTISTAETDEVTLTQLTLNNSAYQLEETIDLTTIKAGVSILKVGTVVSSYDIATKTIEEDMISFVLTK